MYLVLKLGTNLKKKKIIKTEIWNIVNDNSFFKENETN